ncbi:MAG: helix-turn-helix domain-containing protein [Acidobacteriales bacterium]|nr:helix-turn-helix domain-containing protein [Terriglobales bacterium]
MNNENVIETLAQSKLYHEYERAFTDVTGLPITLRGPDAWKLPHHGARNENRFCAMMAQKSRSCAACLKVQQQLAEAAAIDATTVTCPVGMCDSAVPVRLGGKTLGTLQTGQVFRKKPTEAQFKRVAEQAEKWGLEIPLEELRKAYFETPLLSPKQHDGVVKLLSIFAEHVANLSNQLLVQRENAEPPAITRAKAFIQEHHTEDISLEQVAKSVHMSTFYFCKMFHKSTGVNFTEYVSRVRIEKARNLLLNPNLRISEIAYEVGFQSLTHFNRVFKKLLGQSPTEFRAQLKIA